MGGSSGQGEAGVRALTAGEEEGLPQARPPLGSLLVQMSP